MRIDEKNRIVYKAVGGSTTILSCKRHYSDK
ncbi:MAG: type II toxin-antitoxin system YoeB family toxin [Lachnospiraceae bacterium]|nr:type II toxin-antitoxin system YoeB family toxin [Lachnospiraceae bacterium]